MCDIVPITDHGEEDVDRTHTDWFNRVEVDVVDGASVSGQFVEDATTGCVPHVDMSVA